MILLNSPRRGKVWFTFALLCTCFFALAQEDPEAEAEVKSDNVNSNRKYKNEIGIDLSPLEFVLSESGAGYPSLFYRRHFTKDKAVKSMSGIKKTTFHAYRFRVGSNLSFEKFDTPDIREIQLTVDNYYRYNYYYDHSLENKTSVFVRVGVERQIRSKRFELFYGYDVLVDYSNYKTYHLEVLVVNEGTPDLYNINYEQEYKEKKISFGVAAIGGFKYFLTPRLCFSAEATIDIKYSYTNKDHQYRQFDTSTQEYLDDGLPYSTSGIKMNINPLFVINMGYYF
jgi:hypothetical protein